MRIRTFAASVAVATLATVPLAGVAAAQPAGDRDCPDFGSQAEAQAALDSRAGDPERLDADDDGIACESFFGEPTGDSDGDDEGQVAVVPEGGVETGDGSGGGGAPTIALLVAAALAGSAAVAGRRVAGRAR